MKALVPSGMKLKSPDYSKAVLYARIGRKPTSDRPFLLQFPFQQHAVHPTAQGGVIGGFLDYKIFLKKEETRIFNQNDPQNSIEIWKIRLFGVIHDVVAQFINLSL